MLANWLLQYCTVILEISKVCKPLEFFIAFLQVELSCRMQKYIKRFKCHIKDHNLEKTTKTKIWERNGKLRKMLLVWWNNVRKNYNSLSSNCCSQKAESTSKICINFKAKNIISVTAKIFLHILKCGAAQK